MATCRECIHFADCLEMGKTRYYGKESACGNVEKLCKFFKPTADVAEVVRCKDCKHCRQLAPHCEINRYAYFHCALWRGEETKNVWHKYKKYSADYSIVEPTDFCSYGERSTDNAKSVD